METPCLRPPSPSTRGGKRLLHADCRERYSRSYFSYPGRANFLVSGDKQHFGKMKELNKHPCRVATPSEFIDSILPEILKELEKKG